MLVLTRKLGEKVIINDTITLTVVSIDGDRVRLGFEAPREIPIYRAELVDRLEHGRFDPDLAAKPAEWRDERVRPNLTVRRS